MMETISQLPSGIPKGQLKFLILLQTTGYKEGQTYSQELEQITFNGQA
jgi:hypothetical protein